MSIPKKTSRPIRINEIDYRWAESVVPLDDGYCQINLTIQSRVGTMRRIYAKCVCKMDWSGGREKLTLPGHVAAVIRHVQEQGWDPLAATEDFRLTDFDEIAGDMEHPFYTPDPRRSSDE